MVELFRHRVDGEEPSSCVHETRLGVVKFTGTLLCLSFLACEQVVGTRGGVLGIEQATVGCVVECSEGIAACVRYCPCAAQVVGDVVVCRPAVSLKCCPAACNGKTLGGYCAALQFPFYRTRVEKPISTFVYSPELDSLTLSRPTRYKLRLYYA